MQTFWGEKIAKILRKKYGREIIDYDYDYE